ncbi:MAG: 7TM diverse intracellular signaling domain-containing protein, partial [Vulcanimicrobiaceae bacterium]
MSAAAVGRGAGACASPALAAPRLGPAEIPPAVRALAGNRTDESAWFGLTVDQPLGAGAFLIAPSGTRYAGAYVRAGGAWKRFSFEQRLPFRGRPFYHGPPALELRADWFDGRTLYLEFPPEAAATSVQCVTLESAAQAASDGPPDGIIFYFGLLTAIALYNLLLFAGTREASAGWYVGYLAMLGIYQFMRANFGWALFAPTGWFEESNVEFFAFTTTLAVHGQFSRVLLETRKHLPRLDRAIVLVIGALVLVHPTLQLLAVHMPIFREAMPLPTIVLLPAFAGLIIWAAIARRREGYPPARFFLLSYSVLCGFTLLAVFAWAYGITGRLIDYSAEFGTGAECILLSLAVADRLRMERRLQSLVGQLPDVVVRARRNGTISYVSANVAHRFGYEPNRLIGRRIAEFVGNDDPRTLARAARNALRLTSAANPVELQLKRANGSLATVEVVGRPTIAGTRPPSRSAEWQ